VNESAVVKVVLAAYYRGGSSFLGEILNNNPEALYMFEPLIYPFNHWRKKLKERGADGTMYFYPNGTL